MPVNPCRLYGHEQRGEKPTQPQPFGLERFWFLNGVRFEIEGHKGILISKPPCSRPNLLQQLHPGLGNSSWNGGPYTPVGNRRNFLEFEASNCIDGFLSALL